MVRVCVCSACSMRRCCCKVLGKMSRPGMAEMTSRKGECKNKQNMLSSRHGAGSA